jgi:hypothetical protein
MTVRRRLGVILAGPMLAATLGVGSVAATSPGTFNFYDCNTGPDFTATKTETGSANLVSGASAFHIVGTRDLFVVLSFSQLSHGIAQSGQATLWCLVNTNHGTLTFYGFIVSAG